MSGSGRGLATKLPGVLGTALAIAIGTLPLWWVLFSQIPAQREAFERASLGEALLARVQQLEAEGQRSEAIRQLDQALAGLPPEGAVELRLTRAVLRMRAGDLAQARAALEGLVALHPTHAAARNALGVACERAGDFDAALAHYEASVGLAEDVAEYAANLGLLAFRQGDAAGARAALERARALGSPRLAVGRALARLEAGGRRAP